MIVKKYMLVIAAALVAAAPAPAHAQRQSLADRVAALEVKANNPQANLDLLNRIEQQQTELRELRSQLEQLQNENEQLKQRNRDQYLDVDGRLQRLESDPGATPPVSPPVSGAASSAPVAAPASNPAPAERAPSVHGDVGAMAAAGDERAAYNAAFDQLKAGKYAESAELFTSFLTLYPDGVYAPNALYWLGESYYVTQNYQMAAEQFRALLDRYPTHDKASGALLKLGLSEFGLGNVDEAERTLTDVVTRYPGSDVANIASGHLRSMQLGRLR